MAANVYEVIVKRGEDIKAAITEYILAQQWKNVYITGAIGSVIDVVFSAPIDNKLPLRVAYTPVIGAAEIIHLVGEVMPIERMDNELKSIYTGEDPLFVHIHAACAIAGGEVFGGGLSEGKAFRALRVFMIPLEEAQHE